MVQQTQVGSEPCDYKLTGRDPCVKLVLGCGKEDCRENASTNDLEKWTLTLAGGIDRYDSTNVHQVLAELDKSRDRRSLDFGDLYFSLQNAIKDRVGNRPIFRALVVAMNWGRRSCS